MIIVQTPFSHGYAYVFVKSSFDGKIRICSSEDRKYGSVDDVENRLIQAALKLTGINTGLEIVLTTELSPEDINTSYSMTVALLHALYAYQGRTISPEKLGQQAYQLAKANFLIASKQSKVVFNESE